MEKQQEEPTHVVAWKDRFETFASLEDAQAFADELDEESEICRLGKRHTLPSLPASGGVGR